MKASIKFRDEQKPMLRAKIPLTVFNLPFQSGIAAGTSKELSLYLSTFFHSGPSLKFSYRPNDSQNPFGLSFKTGIGSFGSPNGSPLTMSAEFNLVGNQNPSFFIHFKPDFGDFSLKKSQSSGFVKSLEGKMNGGVVGEGNFVNNGYSKGGGFLSAIMESKAAAGYALGQLVKGTEMSAKTTMPLRDFAVVNFRWGLRFPPQEVATTSVVDEVVVGKRCDRTAGIRLPLLVMNKIGIEHVTKSNSKGKQLGGDKTYEKLGGMCTEVKKQLEVIQAENGVLSKSLSDLRSDMSAGIGKMDFLSEHQQEKYSAGGAEKKHSISGNGEKKPAEGMGSGKEG